MRKVFNWHSHNASHTGSRSWWGGACLTGRPYTCASFAALFLLTLRSSLHGDLVVPFARSATMQSRSFSVVVQQPGTDNGLPSDQFEPGVTGQIIPPPGLYPQGRSSYGGNEAEIFIIAILGGGNNIFVNIKLIFTFLVFNYGSRIV